jgi:signal transduction histidine kinase
VVVTAQTSEAWSELLAVDPVAFRERLGPGVTDPPDGIVVDLTSSPREVSRALRPLGDVFARVATVAIVRDGVGASEAIQLGAAASVRCESDVVTAARAAASICRTLSGRPPEYGALEDTHRRLQQVHAQLLAHSADSGARQAMIVHDLRSPLSVVRGVVSELLEGTPLSPSDRKLVDLMDHASAQLEALIERLEQLYACASESQRLERIDLSALARGVAEGLGRSAVARGKPIRVHADAVQMVHGDRQDLVRVLSNLLGNALRHTRTHVELRVEGDEREVRLSVADDGPGVAPPVRAQIFQGIVRNPAAGRMGLGLAIVHRALERHGGRVSVHDRAERDGPGQEGACFVVRLPRAGDHSP